MMRAVLLAIVLAGNAAIAGDPWDDHALSDDEAARMGREAFPFTPEQIIALGRIFQETRAAASEGPGPRPASSASGSNREQPTARSRSSWPTATRRP